MNTDWSLVTKIAMEKIASKSKVTQVAPGIFSRMTDRGVPVFFGGSGPSRLRALSKGGRTVSKAPRPTLLGGAGTAVDPGQFKKLKRR